jgi:hypothetical protein|nr:MAG TPA: hypothetical protein [Caudoviricetes sp.]
MKIIDSNGNPIEAPDLTKGYLKQETQTVHHDAVEGVEEVSHYETETLPDGTPAIYYDADGREKGRDVRKVVDVPGVDPQPAWDEKVPVMRYILYTAEELAAQEKARKEAEEKAQLPTAEERLAALEAAMLDLLAAQ